MAGGFGLEWEVDWGCLSQELVLEQAKDPGQER